jgi:hypothetical protein
MISPRSCHWFHFEAAKSGYCGMDRAVARVCVEKSCVIWYYDGSLMRELTHPVSVSELAVLLYENRKWLSREN